MPYGQIVRFLCERIFHNLNKISRMHVHILNCSTSSYELITHWILISNSQFVCFIYRLELSRGWAKAAQADGDRICGSQESAVQSSEEDGEEGGAVAVRAVRYSVPSVRGGRVRQEGAARVRAQRGGGPERGAAGTSKLDGSELHHGVQRWQPQQLCHHVIILPGACVHCSFAMQVLVCWLAIFYKVCSAFGRYLMLGVSSVCFVFVFFF